MDDSIWKYPRVSVIILNWNGVKDTIRCVDSLKKISYPNYDIIVVDNGSMRNDTEILRKKYRKTITIIENERNYGAAEGRNIGIRYALENLNPDYIMLVDNDVVVDVRFLDHLVSICENYKKVGIVSSTNYEKGNKRSLIARFDSFAIRGFCRVQRLTNDIFLVDYVSCCAILVKTSLFEEIGLFDHKFFYLGEDYDLCRRAKNAGYEIAVALRSKIWHKKIGGIARQSPAHIYYFRTRNYLFIMRKHGKIIDWLRFLPFYTLNFFVRLIFYSINGRADIARLLVKGLFDGVLKPV